MTSALLSLALALMFKYCKQPGKLFHVCVLCVCVCVWARVQVGIITKQGQVITMKTGQELSSH